MTELSEVSLINIFWLDVVDVQDLAIMRDRFVFLLTSCISSPAYRLRGWQGIVMVEFVMHFWLRFFGPL